MPYFMATLMDNVSAYLEDRVTDGFYYVVHYVKDICEEGEFALPIHTDDLRMTVIKATGYDYDHEAWAWDFAEFVEVRAQDRALVS